MFVELLGLPAAGKSTLLQDCAHQLRQMGRQVEAARELDKTDINMPGYVHRTPVSRALYRYETLRQNHPEYIRFIDDLTAHSQPAKALLMASAVRQEIYKASPDAFDIVLIDEGCIYRGIHMITKQTGDTEALTDAYSELVPTPDAAVYLEFSAEQSHADAVTRLQSRDGGKSTPEVIEQRINAAHGGVDALQKRIGLVERAITQLSRRGVPVIRIPARQDRIQNALKVSETLSILKNSCG